MLIKKLCECAKTYHDNLENRNLMFIYKDEKIKYIETKFIKSNFLHLTGVRILDEKMKAIPFYNRCLKNRIKETDIGYRKDGNTDNKMSVLLRLMHINKNAKIIGDYAKDRIYLHSEKIIGNTNACLGFVKKDGYYICNTSLKEDIRKLTYNNKKIICILSKKIQEKQYSEITYLNKKYIEDIYTSKEILEKIEKEVLDKIY